LAEITQLSSARFVEVQRLDIRAPGRLASTTNTAGQID